MKKDFSKHWKASKDSSKQRKYRYNAPSHIRKKFVSVNLSKELRKKYGLRSVFARKGDKVKIMRGQFKKKTGGITEVSLKKTYVFVEGAEMIKADGGKSMYPIHPSNLQIIELKTGDKFRLKETKEIKQK